METMVEEVIIRNEDEAWESLQLALADRISETASIVFEGWPVFKLTIEGKDFKGTIPTRIMPPILDLQREIYRIYCNAKYSSTDVRKLKAEERELLELVVSIKPGSTKFITELFKALNEIIKSSNMNGRQAVIVLVSVSTLIAAEVGWKDWLTYKEKEHGQEVTVQLSEQETQRLELVTQALTRAPDLERNKEFISDFKNDLSKRLKPEDQIKIGEQPVITGARAAEIVPAVKPEAEEVRIDGEFIIKEVKFPKKFGGKYRFAVTRVFDQKSFMVDATPDKLSEDQITILKDGGFGVKRVLMQINAKELRGQVSAAKLVLIKWPDAE